MAKGSGDNFRNERAAVNRDNDAYPGEFDRWSSRDQGKSSDQIRADIRRTRDHLDRTIDELQQRLDPKELMHSVFQSLRDSSSDVVNRGLCTLKNNPIPTALVGIGVIWLLMNHSRRSAALPMELEYEEYEGYGERFQPVV